MKIFRTIQNQLLIILFITFSAFTISYHFLGISTTTGIISFISSIFTIFGANAGTLIARVHNYKKLDENDNTLINKWEIQRPTEYKKLINDNMVTILTGESGCGKSVLIGQLTELELGRQKILIKRDRYYKVLNVEENYKIIIFDQFEQAFNYNNVLDHMKKIQEFNNAGIKVIIVVRKECVGDVLFYMDRAGLDRFTTIFLTNSDIDPNEIKKHLQELMEKTDEELRADDLLIQIIYDFEYGKLTFIQFDIICTIIAQRRFELLKKYFNNGNYNYDKIIKSYADEVLENYGDRGVVESILYLLALNTWRGYTLIDFQNITFREMKSVKRIVDFLNSQRWIYALNESNYVNRSENQKYEIAHDYYKYIFREICLNVIEPQIRHNIDNYAIEFTKGDRKLLVNRRFKDYINRRKYLNILLYIFIFVIISIGIFDLLNNNKSGLELALTDFVVFGSVLYVYNYYYNFLSLFYYRYVWGIATGYLLCILCVFFNRFWGVCLGAEVVVFGLIMIHIDRNYTLWSDNFFRTRSFNFIIFGSVIMLLGLVFSAYVDVNNIGLMLIFYILYTMFIFSAVASHINERNFMLLTGKIIYNQDILNFDLHLASQQKF